MLRWEDEDPDDDDEGTASLAVGGISAISGVRGKKNKHKLGFQVTPGDPACKEHPKYRGTQKLKRDCAGCRRLYNAKHPVDTIKTEEHFKHDN